MVNFQKNFPIYYGVFQECPLSLIIFNIFINIIFDKCKRYGVINERKKCWGSLFADDIVMLAPVKSSLKNLLHKAHDWGFKNDIIFGININGYPF